MIALAILLIFTLLVTLFAYGRAIVYARSEEYKLDERIKNITR